MRRRYRVAMLAMVACVGGCVYFNTFFHANQAYNEAEKQRIRANQEVAVGGAAQKYEEAIRKASTVLQNHPKSKYADDALMMIGKSFYYTGQYSRGREKFIELTGVFRDSKLVPEARYYTERSGGRPPAPGGPRLTPPWRADNVDLIRPTALIPSGVPTF